MTKSEIITIVRKAAVRYGIPQNLALAVVRKESDFNPLAVSRCGARGLMQLMPRTAKAYGVVDSFDCEQNTNAGCKMLRNLHKQFRGNWQLALAAYNWGSGNVSKKSLPEQWPKETQDYTTKILKWWKAADSEE